MADHGRLCKSPHLSYPWFQGAVLTRRFIGRAARGMCLRPDLCNNPWILTSQPPCTMVAVLGAVDLAPSGRHPRYALPVFTDRGCNRHARLPSAPRGSASGGGDALVPRLLCLASLGLAMHRLTTRPFRCCCVLSWLPSRPPPFAPAEQLLQHGSMHPSEGQPHDGEVHTAVRHAVQRRHRRRSVGNAPHREGQLVGTPYP